MLFSYSSSLSSYFESRQRSFQSFISMDRKAPFAVCERGHFKSCFKNHKLTETENKSVVIFSIFNLCL
jgi:hypothetical protein